MSKLSSAQTHIGVLSGLTDLYVSHNSHKNVVEQEKSKRNDSNNQKEIAIGMIHAQRDVILNALDNDFILKSKALDKSFSVVDKALEDNNLEALQIGLSAVVKVTEHSSLQSLSELQAQLESSSSIIDV